MKINNRNAAPHVRECVDIRGSNVFSKRRNTSTGTGAYIVYSYGEHFPMYIKEGKNWYENIDKYSRSTSRHQSQCRPSGVNTIMPMDTASMLRIAQDGIAGLAAMGPYEE